MTNKMKVWEAVKTPPETALREIKGGRLAGKKDINPTWRLQTLTEQFGPVGYGWRYEIKSIDFRTIGGETACFVIIDLFVKIDDIWSEAICGQGGSMFVALERNGAFMSDECIKMATTDAISVAAKQLGIAADVYLGKFDSKYSDPKQQNRQYQQSTQPKQYSQNAYSSKGGDRKLTEKQRGMIQSLLEKLISNGVAQIELQTNMMRLCNGKENTADLSIKEASDFIGFLKDMEAKQKQQNNPAISDDAVPF